MCNFVFHWLISYRLQLKPPVKVGPLKLLKRKIMSLEPFLNTRRVHLPIHLQTQLNNQHGMKMNGLQAVIKGTKMIKSSSGIYKTMITFLHLSASSIINHHHKHRISILFIFPNNIFILKLYRTSLFLYFAIYVYNFIVIIPRMYLVKRNSSLRRSNKKMLLDQSKYLSNITCTLLLVTPLNLISINWNG